MHCENLEGVGGLDLCDLTEEDTEGPLAIFAFQDPFHLNGKKSHKQKRADNSQQRRHLLSGNNPGLCSYWT